MFKVPSNSSLSTLISSDFAYAWNPTINWHGMVLGPTGKKSKQDNYKSTDKIEIYTKICITKNSLYVYHQKSSIS